MADTVTSRHVYPPNWDGYYAGNQKGHKRYVVNLTCVSDGTGESDVRKITVGDYLTVNGDTATRLAIEKVEFSCYGFTSILLEFDGVPDDPICVIGGNDSDCLDYRPVGGIVDNNEEGTGDIMLTSSGATSGDSYNITITFRPKA